MNRTFAIVSTALPAAASSAYADAAVMQRELDLQRHLARGTRQDLQP